MPSSSKSSITKQKPMNIFYVWYTELCRRANASPLSIVKPAKPKNDTVLDVTTDRIKPEEWLLILNALRLDTSLHVIAIRSRVIGCKFFYDINSEDKARKTKRHGPSLWTDYIFNLLIRSLGSCLKNSQVLSNLELDGLPLSGEYLSMLLQTLSKNRTVKMLSFKHSPINDYGCQQLCLHLRFMPNVEVLNLTRCNLTSLSGQYIAGIIKHQQINRYSESWHNSLRYEDPDVGIMAGLKRITLNNNPGLGDEGLSYILEQLVDDLWIKAIDMQHCNITENISKRIVDVIEYSRSLEVADFRNNELTYATVERILDVLDRKHQFGNDPEYEWCMTSSTLYDFGNYEASRSSVIQKSRSAPLRQVVESRELMKQPLRRTKTVALIDRGSRADKKQLDDAKRQLNQLNAKLQQEMLKRKETEKINSELTKKLDEIRKLGSVGDFSVGVQKAWADELKSGFGKRRPRMPKVSNATKMSNVAKMSSATNMSYVTKMSNVAQMLNVTKRSNVTKTPDAPKTPDAQKTPDVQKRPDPQNRPDAQKRPDSQKRPNAQKRPDAQKRPKTPKTPKAPKAPKLKPNSSSIQTDIQMIFERFLYKETRMDYEDDFSDAGKLEDFLSHCYDNRDFGQTSAQQNFPKVQFSELPASPKNANSSTSLERLLEEIEDNFDDLQADNSNSPRSPRKSVRYNVVNPSSPRCHEHFDKIMVHV